jgi:hypothetical protein
MDGETDIYFPAKLLSLVAKLAEARKKRRLSKVARERLIQVGKAYQFKRQNDGVESQKSAQI